jgi:hypothetical protein
MEPLTAHAPVLQSARVTLDVLHTGVFWGWFVTMNFWSKSISTGVFLVGAFFMRKGPSRDFYRLVIPAVAFVFVDITLLFTVLDLHQPFRFWHMFVYPHPTSVINLGAWVLSVYVGLTFVMTVLAWKRQDGLYDRLIGPTWVVGFLATIYTAGLLGQSTARELWSTPTEVAQMILAATLAGSAVFLLLGKGHDQDSTVFAWVLALSAMVALTIYVTEVVFAPQKSEEAEFIVHALLSGNLGVLFYSGLVLGFVVPGVLALIGLRGKTPLLFPLAAVSSLVGLWLVKHAWLIAPQLLPLS